MGIDYESVAGYGIVLNSDDLDKYKLPIEDWSDWDVYEKIEVILKDSKNIVYSVSGDVYSGEYYDFLIQPKNFPRNIDEFFAKGKEIWEDFLKELKKIGIDKTFEDIVFYSEVYIC